MAWVIVHSIEGSTGVPRPPMSGQPRSN